MEGGVIIKKQNVRHQQLVVVTGFPSSGSVFGAQVVSYVLGKCTHFGQWSGYGWNGKHGDDLVIVHHSMPYELNPKKWWPEMLTELREFAGYEVRWLICTRDLSISRASRLLRWGGKISEYYRDDLKAKKIFARLLQDETVFVLSYESAMSLGDAYYRTLYDWLQVDSKFSPPTHDANAKYVKNRLGKRLLLMLRRKLQVIGKLSKSAIVRLARLSD